MEIVLKDYRDRGECRHDIPNELFACHGLSQREAGLISTTVLSLESFLWKCIVGYAFLPQGTGQLPAIVESILSTPFMGTSSCNPNKGKHPPEKYNLN